MLSVIHATKRFRGATRHALDDVSFDVTPGEVCCVIGRNGAGKSTLMSAIAGLHHLTSGQVLLDGRSLPDDAHLRRRVGYAAQSEALYPLLTGRENLKTFGRLAGLGRAELARRVDDVTAALRISDFMDQPVRTMSGGERRRIHVAVALLDDRDVVMLDEPTAGVDPVTRSDVLGLVRSVAERGAMVLYSTHYLHEVEALGADVVILEHGRRIAAGPVPAIIAQHGGSWIEMSFAEPIDTTALPWVCKQIDDRLRFMVEQPDIELPRILERLGADAVNLRSLVIHQPNLESVFLDLTGQAPEEIDLDRLDDDPAA